MSGMIEESYFTTNTGSGSFSSRTALASDSPPILQDQDMVMDHPYESPQTIEFQLDLERQREKIKKHKKKKCLLYEPAENPKHVHYNDEDSDGAGVRYVHHHDTLYKWFFVLLFILVLMSLAMSSASIAGIKFGGKVGNCLCGAVKRFDMDTTPATGKSHSNDVITSDVFISDDTKIKELEANLTYLKEVIIPDLKSQLMKEKQKGNRSDLIGPPGPPGQNGSPGRPGADGADGAQGIQGVQGVQGLSGSGNISLCKYYYLNSHSTVASTVDRTHATTAIRCSTPEVTILGVTCASTGAAEYTLQHFQRSNNDCFFCECAGKATSTQLSPQKNQIICGMHRWECPTIS